MLSMDADSTVGLLNVSLEYLPVTTVDCLCDAEVEVNAGLDLSGVFDLEVLSLSMAEQALRTLRSRDKGSSRDPTHDSSSLLDIVDDPVMSSPAVTSHMHRRMNDAKRKSKDAFVTVATCPKKRRLGPDLKEVIQDGYCWECHDVCVQDASDCSTCPRTFHRECLKKAPSQEDLANDCWACPVCQIILKAECADTRSWAMQLLSSERFASALNFALQRMKHKDSDAFQLPVPKDQCPDYYEYVFHPMDLQTLESHVRARLYSSTEAFVADAKWILHNCIVYNGPTSKYTNDAKLIVKIACFEVSEIELCPDCYLNSCIRRNDWFAEPCNPPHCLVWAKLRGYPYWPAKALRVSKNNVVDVRFFGAHDRSWIPQNLVFLLSEEPPVPVKNSKKIKGYDQAIEEMQLHMDLVQHKVPDFKYAPPNIEFQPEHLYNCPHMFGTSGEGAAGPNGHERRRRRGSVSSTVSDEAEDLNASNCAFRSERPTSPSSSVGTSSEGVKKPTPPKKEAPSFLGKSESQTSGVFTMDESMEQEMNLLLSEHEGDESLGGGKGAKLVGKGNDRAGLEDRCLDRISESLRQDTEERCADSPEKTKRKRTNLDSFIQKLNKDQQQEKGAEAGQANSISGKNAILNVEGLPMSALGGPSPPKLRRSNESVTVTTAPTVNRSNGPTLGTSSNAKGVSVQKCAEKISEFVRTALDQLAGQLNVGAGVGFVCEHGELCQSQMPSSTAEESAQVAELINETKQLGWMQERAIAELKQNTALALSEMRTAFEVDKKNSLEQLRGMQEENLKRAVAEAKAKQWCANCGKEAMFYCCWNTSYCDYPCQQQHWTKHQETCAQVRPAEIAPPPAYVTRPATATIGSLRHGAPGGPPSRYYAPTGAFRMGAPPLQTSSPIGAPAVTYLTGLRSHPSMR